MDLDNVLQDLSTGKEYKNDIPYPPEISLSHISHKHKSQDSALNDFDEQDFAQGNRFRVSFDNAAPKDVVLVDRKGDNTCPNTMEVLRHKPLGKFIANAVIGKPDLFELEDGRVRIVCVLPPASIL